MKITDEGYTLTQLPGIERITVEPSEGSEYGIRIMIKFVSFGSVLNFGVNELEEVYEGLAKAVSLARTMALDNGSPK